MNNIQTLNFPEEDFIISALQLGAHQNFIHTIFDRKSKKMAVIDPAWNVPAILDHAHNLGAVITDIFMTHAHHDHHNGVEELMDKTSCRLNMHKEELFVWNPQRDDIQFFEDQDNIAFGSINIEVIFTPGHTPGGTCFKIDNHLITGDTLFVYGCGRCDFPGSDVNKMFTSLAKLKALPESTIIHPGHDYGIEPTSTIGAQKKGNPFLLCSTREEFTQFRMNGPKRSTPYGPSL